MSYKKLLTFVLSSWVEILRLRPSGNRRRPALRMTDNSVWERVGVVQLLLAARRQLLLYKKAIVILSESPVLFRAGVEGSPARKHHKT